MISILIKESLKNKVLTAAAVTIGTEAGKAIIAGISRYINDWYELRQEKNEKDLLVHNEQKDKLTKENK